MHPPVVVVVVVVVDWVVFVAVEVDEGEAEESEDEGGGGSGEDEGSGGEAEDGAGGLKALLELLKCLPSNDLRLLGVILDAVAGGDEIVPVGKGIPLAEPTAMKAMERPRLLPSTCLRSPNLGHLIVLVIEHSGKNAQAHVRQLQNFH
jgi:hypothetical protein